MRVQDEEARISLMLRQCAEKAVRRDMAVPGRFISAEDRPIAIHEAKAAGAEVCLNGGWPDAERLQVCFLPTGSDPEFTAVWLKAEWNVKFASPSHQDLLGSLLGTGIDRSYIGDLVIQENDAWLYALPEIAARLPSEWTQAGRIPIRVSVQENTPDLIPAQGKLLHETIASQRLDCVLSAGLRISRASAAELIRSGRVALNHHPETRIDTEVDEGAVLSIRGMGRIRLKNILGRTKHDRLSAELELFLKKG